MKCKVHLYQLMEVGLKKKVVFKCLDCAHYLPMPELMIGRESRCHGVCGGTVVYSKDDFQQSLKFPMCGKCRELRKQQKAELSSIG